MKRNATPYAPIGAVQVSWIDFYTFGIACCWLETSGYDALRREERKEVVVIRRDCAHLVAS